MNRLEVDGSHGEGGGQILRTALALSAICGKGIQVDRIRAGRKKPGLLAQHLTCVRSAQVISGARVEGARFGSSRILFEPGEIGGGEHSFDVAEERGSAGSVDLVLQTLLPILALGGSPSRITVRGGTHVRWAPPYHYVEGILLTTLRRMGITAEMSLKRWGYYPLGGGEVSVKIEPAESVDGIDLRERGELEKLRVLSAVSNLPVSIGERQLDRAIGRLKGRGFDPEPELLEGESPGKGTFCFISAEFGNSRCGFSSLGERGKRAEAVADEACDGFFSYLESGAAIEEHLADQLVIFAALAKGVSSFTTSRVTQHLLTNIWVVQQFLSVELRLEGELGQVGRLEVEGAGMRPCL